MQESVVSGLMQALFISFTKFGPSEVDARDRKLSLAHVITGFFHFIHKVQPMAKLNFAIANTVTVFNTCDCYKTLC